MDVSILIVRGFKKIISKWGKKLFQSGEASTTFYFKVGQALFQRRGKDSYFKVGQCLFQSGAIYFKVGQLLQSGAKCYFKVGQLFQSGA